MKTRKILAVVAGLALAAGFAPSPAGAAGKATAKTLMTGDCFDGDMLEGVDEDNCQIMVTVTPKNKNVSAVLEVAYDEGEPEWEEYDSGKTRGGRLIFDIASTDEDDVWMDGTVLYRVRVKKTAGVTVPKVREYKVVYKSSENVDEEDTAMTDEEKAEEAEMDKAMAENQQHIQKQQPNYPYEAFQILGNRAADWCAAVAESFGKKAECSMVMMNVFPPPTSTGPMPGGTSTMPTGG